MHLLIINKVNLLFILKCYVRKEILINGGKANRNYHDTTQFSNLQMSVRTGNFAKAKEADSHFKVLNIFKRTSTTNFKTLKSYFNESS